MWCVNDKDRTGQDRTLLLCTCTWILIRTQQWYGSETEFASHLILLIRVFGGTSIVRPYAEEEGGVESQAVGALLRLLRREGFGAFVLGALVGFLDLGLRVLFTIEGDTLGHDVDTQDGDALGLGVDGGRQLRIYLK